MISSTTTIKFPTDISIYILLFFTLIVFPNIHPYSSEYNLYFISFTTSIISLILIIYFLSLKFRSINVYLHANKSTL